MIIDAHSHIGRYGEVWSPKFANGMLHQFGKFPKWWGDQKPWKAEDFDIDPDRYVAHMNEAGVDKAIVWGLACEPFECKTPPEIVAAVVKQHPDRFIGYHTADPIGYADDGPDVLEHAVKNLGLKGVKIYPGYNNGAANDARLFPIYQKAQELDIPVTVHTGYTVAHMGPNAYTSLSKMHPLLLEEVAATFPRLRLVMAHFSSPWAQEATQLMRKYDNVYVDTCYDAFPFSYQANALVWAKNFNVLHKVLWGSDYPLRSPAGSIKNHWRMPEYTRQHGIEPGLTEDDIENVLGRNAARFLGLENT